MDVEDKGTFYKCTFSRMDILELWRIANGSETEKARCIVGKILEMVPDQENVDIVMLRKRIQYISMKLMKFWKTATRCVDKVKKTHSEWLNTQETVELHKSDASTSACEVPEQTSSVSSNIGRPKKDLADCSKRTQRRRLAELSKLDQTAFNTLTDISSYSDTIPCEVSPDEVLSLLTEAKLTKHQYLLIKEFVNSKRSPVLPSYQKVLEAKKRCYPENRAASEKGADVEL